MNKFCLFLGALLCAAFGSLTLHAVAAGETPNFLLLDLDGKARELHRAKGRAVVLFFTGVGCPVARKSMAKLRDLQAHYGEGVDVWLIDSETGDTPESVRKETQEFGAGPLPVLLDDTQALALALDVQRTGEVIALDSRDWRAFYRGAIDDQLSEGAEKPAPTENYLQSAIDAHLAGREVAVPRTPAKGCLITFEKGAPPAGEQISYIKQVAPILLDKCAGCHREGDIGPFAFSSYAVAKKKSRMIEEVLLTRQMPPWHADPHFGKFSNAIAPSALEVQTLVRWIRAGAPRDEGADPLAAPTSVPQKWPLGEPDYIVKLPAPEQIPASGVLEYRHIRIPSPISEDAWLAATVVNPGNRKVVHHVIVYASFEGSGKDLGGEGVKIAGWAPGRLPGRLPEGTGIFLGKNASLNFELHYTTNGTAQTDQTEIGLYLLKDKPRLVYKTGMAIQLGFTIPPNEPEARTSAMFEFQRDSILYTLTPHMHVRGSWIKYEALLPDGSRETLISVPRFDFKWQTSYRLAEPRTFPKGTKILCTGAFDNSPQNLSNPDPAKQVKWGNQSWEEMFIGYIGYAEVAGS